MTDLVNAFVNLAVTKLVGEDEKSWFETCRIEPKRVRVTARSAREADSEAYVVARVEGGPFFLGFTRYKDRRSEDLYWNIYILSDGELRIYDGPWPTLFGAIEEVWFGLELKPKPAKAV